LFNNLYKYSVGCYSFEGSGDDPNEVDTALLADLQQLQEAETATLLVKCADDVITSAQMKSWKAGLAADRRSGHHP
jgi:hypothetical protein